MTVIFFVSGAALGSWFTRIPAVQERIGLRESELGLVLLALAGGAVLAMPVAGWLVARLGSRPMATITAVSCCAALPLPALAPSLPTLALALFTLGASNGALDVALNAHGAAVERRAHRPVFSSFHAAWAIGGLAGGAGGALTAAAGIEPLVHFLIVSALLIGVVMVATPRLLPARADAIRRGTFVARPSKRLAGLGALAFCGLLSEGAMYDWSAVYLSSSLSAGPGLAAAGFVAFSLMLAAGRLVGDRLVQAWGPVAVSRRSGLLATVGLGAALVTGHPTAALAGFACAGAGLASVMPLVISAAGRTHALASAPAIAVVNTTGYLGFVAGPPVIGIVAELSSLPMALGIAVVLSAAIVPLSQTLSPPGSNYVASQRAEQPSALSCR